MTSLKQFCVIVRDTFIKRFVHRKPILIPGVDEKKEKQRTMLRRFRFVPLLLAFLFPTYPGRSKETLLAGYSSMLERVFFLGLVIQSCFSKSFFIVFYNCLCN